METMTIYFDMDGTIADLYGVQHWLPMLRAESPRPYLEAKPMIDMTLLQQHLLGLQAAGVHVGVITWLAKDSTKEYKKIVREAKKAWLKKHLPSVDFDYIHMVQYGTRKDYVAKNKGTILFDDDATVRENWRGVAYDPAQVDILGVLEHVGKIYTA